MSAFGLQEYCQKIHEFTRTVEPETYCWSSVNYTPTRSSKPCPQCTMHGSYGCWSCSHASLSSVACRSLAGSWTSDSQRTDGCLAERSKLCGNGDSLGFLPSRIRCLHDNGAPVTRIDVAQRRLGHHTEKIRLFCNVHLCELDRLWKEASAIIVISPVLLSRNQSML